MAFANQGTHKILFIKSFDIYTNYRLQILAFPVALVQPTVGRHHTIHFP